MAPLISRLGQAFGFGAPTGGGGGGDDSPTGTYATGGPVTDSSGTRIHTFTSSGSFVVVNENLNSVNYLIVAGGAGGSSGAGGGGGAGGMYTTDPAVPSPERAAALTVTGNGSSPNSYTVTVGAGGEGGGNSAQAVGELSLIHI